MNPKFKSAALFIAGVLYFIDFTALARVRYAELWIFALAPLWIGEGLQLFRINRSGARLFLMLLLYLLSVIASCEWNGAANLDLIKAMGKPLFVGAHAAFWYACLAGDWGRFKWWVFGAALGSLALIFSQSEYIIEDTDYNEFVFRYTPIVLSWLTVFLVQFYRRNLILCWAFLASACVILALNSARSVVGTVLLTGAMLTWRRVGAGSMVNAFANPAKTMRVAVISILVASTGVYYAYITLAPRGYLGELQMDKLQSQEQSTFGNTPWGLLLTSRTKVLGAVLGIRDRPLLGFGGPSSETYIYEVEALSLIGVDISAADAAKLSVDRVGAGHSIFFGEWMMYGIGAAVFWIYCCIQMLRVMVAKLAIGGDDLPMVLLWGLGLLWALFFSPFGIDDRHRAGFFLAAAVVLQQAYGDQAYLKMFYRNIRPGLRAKLHA